jgi:hypothetical protein
MLYVTLLTPMSTQERRDRPLRRRGDGRRERRLDVPERYRP